MTARANFRTMLRERRAHPQGSLDWQWRTAAARTYLRILRKVPTTEWTA